MDIIWDKNKLRWVWQTDLSVFDNLFSLEQVEEAGTLPIVAQEWGATTPPSIGISPTPEVWAKSCMMELACRQQYSTVITLSYMGPFFVRNLLVCLAARRNQHNRGQGRRRNQHNRGQGRRVKVKGRPSPTNENSAALQLLVHELNMKSCPYPVRVVECIYVTFERWGISRDRFSLRYHLNFHEDDWTAPKAATATVQPPIAAEIMELAVTQECHQVAVTQESPASVTGARERLNHKLHFDSSQKQTDAGEMQIRRGVATIPIQCTLPEMHALKMKITELKDDIQEKTGEPTFDFETIVGKARYPCETLSAQGRKGRLPRDFT